MERDDPRQQAKTDDSQQPDICAQWQHLRAFMQQRKFKRAIALPHQPARQRKQQRAESSKCKPQLAGYTTSGEEHAAKGHDLRHHDQRAQVTGGDGANRGRHQQIHQQAVRFDLRVTMPVNIKQADKKPHRPKVTSQMAFSGES